MHSLPPALRVGVPACALLAGVSALVLALVTADLGSGRDSAEPAASVRLDAARLSGPEPRPWSAGSPQRGADDRVVVLRGRGWGHSVGMSQYGAQAQALEGRGYRDILAHYYPGTTVEAHRAAAGDLRVGLFRNRDVNDPDRLRLLTTGQGGEPDRPVEVELGGTVTPLPPGQVWTLLADGDDLTLVDGDGHAHSAGAAPASVRFQFAEGTPTLLRLPQLARSGQPLSGTLRWGVLEVDTSDGGVRPTLVVPLERYLRGLAEMPSSWEPDALMAQAIAGRTYAVRKVLAGKDDDCGCHLGTTPHDQAFAGWQKEGGPGGERWRAAVVRTAGEVVTYRGELAWTFYSSSHGGRTEAAQDSWAYGEAQAAPYLVSVDDPWSLADSIPNPKASWERELPAEEFARAVGLVELHSVEISDRTDGGSPAELEVTGIDFAGNEVRYGFRGWRSGVAASELKLYFRAELPSQQLTSIELVEAQP